MTYLDRIMALESGELSISTTNNSIGFVLLFPLPVPPNANANKEINNIGIKKVSNTALLSEKNSFKSFLKIVSIILLGLVNG